jgi:hypothetical protein
MVVMAVGVHVTRVGRMAVWSSGRVARGLAPICDGPALCRWAGPI